MEFNCSTGEAGPNLQDAGSWRVDGVASQPRGHQDLVEQGGLDADPAQHEHLHRAEAGGRLPGDLP